MNDLVGHSASLTFIVTVYDTAIALGSGSVAVLATPRLLAWCEAATCAAIEDALPDGVTTVGVRVELDHVKATAVGASVEVTATVALVNGRRIRFDVTATDPTGAVVATGIVSRVQVEAATFAR